MSKELAKKGWMVLGAVVMVLGTASAARADDKVVATVPFDFIVGNVRMPAGNYTVTRISDSALISVQSSDHKHFAFALANNVTTNQPAATPVLVFDKFEGNTFLARVMGSDADGREIPLTPKVMQRETDRVTVAAAAEQ